VRDWRAFWLVYPTFYAVVHVLAFKKIPYFHVVSHYLQSTATLGFLDFLPIPLQLSYNPIVTSKNPKCWPTIYGVVFFQIMSAIYHWMVPKNELQLVYGMLDFGGE
jgi:hypothetical protein